MSRLAKQPDRNGRQVDADLEPKSEAESHATRLAERQVAGIAILDPSLLGRECTINELHFADDKLGEIFAVAYGQWKKTGRQQTVAEVRLELKRRSKLDYVGGSEELAKLAHEEIVLAHAEYYAGEVRKHWARRNTREVARNLIRQSYNSDADLRDFVGELSELISETNTTPITPILSASTLVDNNPKLRPPIIENLLRRGEVANVISAAKTGKSWMVHQLACCIASGNPWLSFDVHPGRTLLIDNELHPETLAFRLNRVANELRLTNEQFSQIDTMPLRGQLCDLYGLQKHFAGIKPGSYQVIILDALYRFLPRGIDENANADMTTLYNQLNHYASMLDSAIVIVHHSSKGDQGGKAITDVGAGAGAISRAPDVHLAIRPHESEGSCVLQGEVRSWKQPEALTIAFEWPLWFATTLEPKVRQSGRAGKQADLDAEGKQSICDQLTTKWKTQNAIKDAVGFGIDRVKRLLGMLVSEGMIEHKRFRAKKGGRRLECYRLASTDTSTDENASRSPVSRSSTTAPFRGSSSRSDLLTGQEWSSNAN